MKFIYNKTKTLGRHDRMKSVGDEIEKNSIKKRCNHRRYQQCYHLIVPYLSIILIFFSSFSCGIALYGQAPSSNWKSTRTSQNVISKTNWLTSSSFTYRDYPIHQTIQNEKLLNCNNQYFEFFYIPRKLKKTVYINMGKGDGKKKKKKKTSSSSTAASQPSTPTPLRVSNDINIPVRRQIRYAQMKKEAIRMSGTSFRAKNVKRTSYRKNLGAF